jgi:hypothetical protein
MTQDSWSDSDELNRTLSKANGVILNKYQKFVMPIILHVERSFNPKGLCLL